SGRCGSFVRLLPSLRNLHPSLLLSLAADDPGSFSNGDQLIGGNLFVLLVQTVRPVHVEVSHADSAESEMQARIVAAIVTRLAKHRLRLNFSPVVHHHSGADSASI